MRTVLMFALLFVCALCGRTAAASDDEYNVYEFSFSCGKAHWEFLIIIPDDSNTAVGKGRGISDGEIFGYAEEKFRIKVEDEGVALLGYDVKSNLNYSPDNFVILKSGKAVNIDDDGRTIPIEIRTVKPSEYRRVINKYDL